MLSTLTKRSTELKEYFTNHHIVITFYQIVIFTKIVINRFDMGKKYITRVKVVYYSMKVNQKRK